MSQLGKEREYYEHLAGTEARAAACYTPYSTQDGHVTKNDVCKLSTVPKLRNTGVK